MNAITKVCQDLATGFSMGLAAKNAPSPFKNIDEALKAATSEQLDAFLDGIALLFSNEKQGVEILAQSDLLIEKHPEFEDLREYLIDLCLVFLLTNLEDEEDGNSAEDVLESPEWAKIESASEERGTELLNALIYIKDCKLNEVEPDLEDFLYEFLLADDEDFQEEMAIYEPFVRQAELIDAPLKQLIQAGNHQRANELRDLFTPLMLFFRDVEAKPGKITLSLLENSAEPELHCSLYRLLCGFYAVEI